MGNVIDKIAGDCFDTKIPDCSLEGKDLLELPECKTLNECSHRDRAVLQEIFNLFDTDGNGEIDDTELKIGLLKFGSIVTDKTVAKMVKQLDIGGGAPIKSKQLDRSNSMDVVARLKERSQANAQRKDQQISYEEFSRGLLARNSLLYFFLYDNKNDSCAEVEQELKGLEANEKRSRKKSMLPGIFRKKEKGSENK